jgi:PAS domain S-box-containing protein
MKEDINGAIDRLDLIQEHISAPASDLSYINTIMHTLVEKSLCGILIVSMGKIHFVNEAFEQITGYTKEDVRNMAPWDMVHPDARDDVRAMGLERFEGKNIKDYYQTPWIHKDGHKIWMEVRAALLHGTNPPKILANVIDISERKKAQEELEKSELELRSQSRKLEETNTALKVLLRQRNDEMEELKNNFLFNVEKLVMPYIDELETSHMNIRHKGYVQIIKENLKEIIAPYIRKISADYANLTSKQIEVINLVRQGKSTKDIAKILCISEAAVDFRRHNIRRKLNLTQKKVNLRTFLDLMEQGDKHS